MQPPLRGLKAFGVLTCLFLLPLPGLLAGCSGGGGDLSFATEYQAVFLDSGQVFFGKIKDAGGNFLSLHDVYFVQRQVEADKKGARNILMRLGSEWHGPDFMRINTRHIVRLEPGGPGFPGGPAYPGGQDGPGPGCAARGSGPGSGPCAS